MSTEPDTKAALFKMGWAWFAVGLSQMTPLQWVQLIAAIAATIFSIVQTYFLIVNRGKK